ncbi:MAG: LysR family transcriptional regulator [Flavobacteriales bacterium]|nr:LysR family transcriptional regulator [Flavobacteriales bacterium]
MNFQQLEYIVALAERQHFGKAAQDCYVTQATLSAMIKKLEEELNVQLFDRSSHPVLPTEVGQLIIQQAKVILHGQEELVALAAQDNHILNGELKVGVIPTVANSLLPIILKHIIKAHPELRLDIMEVTTEEIKSRLKNGSIDIGILVTPIHDPALEEEVLYYESLMVYGVEDENKKFMLSEDINSSKVWLLEEGHCFKNQAMTLCKIQEDRSRTEHLEFSGSSFETLLNLSDTFGGFTLIPELFYQTLPAHRKKRTRGFGSPIPVREVSIVSHRPAIRRNIIGKLKDLIQERVSPRLLTQELEESEMDIISI